MHAQEDCKALTKYKDYGGPHRVESHKCLARSTRSGNPTREQLKVYRQAGHRDYQVVLRAITVEAKAAIAEDSYEFIEIPTNSKSSTISATNNKTLNDIQKSNTCTVNLNESLAGISTSAEMRL